MDGPVEKLRLMKQHGAALRRAGRSLEELRAMSCAELRKVIAELPGDVKPIIVQE
jgi:hypothetical protein